MNLCSVPIFYTVLNLTFNYIYDLCTETLIEAEEKVLIAQYTSDISDYGSSKKRKCNDGAVETISLIPETRMLFLCLNMFLFCVINFDLKIISKLTNLSIKF